jgi:hypothetical protein
VKDSHSKENITKIIIPILIKMEIISKLGYFITNNVSFNNVITKLILARLRPNIIQPKTRKVRCLGHIINLVAKAFLFNKDKDSFENIELSN